MDAQQHRLGLDASRLDRPTIDHPDRVASVLQRLMVGMSKKSKKQRAKARQAQVRRESGITLRAVSPPSAGGKLIELKPKVVTPPETGDQTAPTTSQTEDRTIATRSEPPRAQTDSLAPEVTPRNALVPGKLLPEDVESPSALERPEQTEQTEQTDAPPDAVGGAGPKAEVPEAAMLEEHRASRRVSLAVDIHLASESHFFSGLSGDISEGGLFVSTYRPITVGTQVDVEFSLPGTDHPVQAKGEVRWIREHSAEQPRGVGIAFEGLSDEDRDEIHAFCSSRPPLYYEDVG